MKYRYQFLLDLYRNRSYHPDNLIWLYRYEHVAQNGHYLKVYLYCRNKYMHLEEVNFQIQQGDQIKTVSVKEFHKIKHNYQPYLKGCLIPVEDDLSDISLEITSYQMDGKTYPFVKEDIKITLTDEQCNQERNALLLQQMDITMMPSIQETYYICACGNIHRIGETCPNCHRPYSEIKAMVEQGQEALCKKALLKKYCRLSELEKRNYKTDQWISDIQQEATALYISCISDDYASFLKQAVSSHRKDIMKTIIVSISVALGLAFSILLFIGLQPTVNDLDKNLLPNDSLYSPYGNNDYGYNDTDDDSDTDNLYSYGDDDYQYKTCSIDQKEMMLYVSLSGKNDKITGMLLSIDIDKEQLGTDPNLLDESQLDMVSSQILSQFGLTGDEDGLYTDIYVVGSSLIIDIDIDVESVDDKTLKALDFEFIKNYSYKQALMEFKLSGMDCY